MKILLLVILSFIGQCLLGQKIDAHTEWKDGIYLSNQAILENSPDIQIERTDFLYTDPLKILRINGSDFGLSEKQTIHAVVQNGLPYVGVERCCPSHRVYIGLSIIGHLSVAFFENEEMVDIPMKAYNPYNGKPYLSGTIQRERKFKTFVILDMKTGMIYQKDKLMSLDKLNMKEAAMDEESILELIVDFNSNNPIEIQ